MNVLHRDPSRWGDGGERASARQGKLGGAVRVPMQAAAKAPYRNLSTGTEMLHLYRVLRDGLLGRDVNRMRAPPAAAEIA